MNEMDIPKSCETRFPNPDKLNEFKVIVCPEEGYYRRGKIVFDVAVPEDFPNEPPKVKCEQKIYHPNIDLQGNVCLNILRQDWSPVVTISQVIAGLEFLFLVSSSLKFFIYILSNFLEIHFSFCKPYT